MAWSDGARQSNEAAAPQAEQRGTEQREHRRTRLGHNCHDAGGFQRAEIPREVAGQRGRGDRVEVTGESTGIEHVEAVAHFRDKAVEGCCYRAK